MSKKLEQAAYRRMLEDETRWQRKKRQVVEALRSKRHRLKEFFKQRTDTIRLTLNASAIIAIALSVVGLSWHASANSYKSYLILSGDRCWFVDRYDRNGDGSIYFDIAHGRIILTEYEAILIKNDEEHDFLATANTMGYPELELDDCYQDPEE